MKQPGASGPFSTTVFRQTPTVSQSDREAPAPRILVLGSEGHGRGVRARYWVALSEQVNVADYDVVVLNFSRVSRPGEQMPTLDQFTRLIFGPESAVIAIGDPTKSFSSEAPLMGRGQPVTTHLPVTWWLPVDLPAKIEKGEAIRNLKQDWRFWFDHVTKYEWHFLDSPRQGDLWKTQQAASAVPGASHFVAEWSSLAETRYGQPIGISLTIYAVSDQSSRPEIIAKSNPVLWLHASTELGDHEAIDLLLREFGGLQPEEAPPPWLDAFRLPNEHQAESEVHERERELGAAEEALSAAKQKAVQEGRYAQLLYAHGKDVLEPVVREALALLGGTVTAPRVEGIEEGRLSDARGRQAMLEIKGRKGQLRLEDVRQLHGWIWTAIENEGWDGKGVLVANLKLEENPTDRTDLIAPNAERFAKEQHIAILTTTQLYEAVRQRQRNSLDESLFWEKIFQADGLVDLPNLSSP